MIDEFYQLTKPSGRTFEVVITSRKGRIISVTNASGRWEYHPTIHADIDFPEQHFDEWIIEPIKRAPDDGWKKVADRYGT